MVLGAAQVKSRHLPELIPQQSTSQPVGYLGSRDENRGVWSSNTYPSASNCAQWEKNPSLPDNMRGRKR